MSLHGRVDGRRAALGLGPIGVLPEHQTEGVGAALMHAVLGAAGLHVGLRGRRAARAPRLLPPIRIRRRPHDRHHANRSRVGRSLPSETLDRVDAASPRHVPLRQTIRRSVDRDRARITDPKEMIEIIDRDERGPTTTTPCRDLRPLPSHAAPLAWWAFGWAVFFTTLHGYWALGGRIGFGDQTDPLPAIAWDLAGTIFTVVVGAMFAAGLAVPLAARSPMGRSIPAACWCRSCGWAPRSWSRGAVSASSTACFVAWASRTDSPDFRTSKRSAARIPPPTPCGPRRRRRVLFHRRRALFVVAYPIPAT